MLEVDGRPGQVELTNPLLQWTPLRDHVDQMASVPHRAGQVQRVELAATDLHRVWVDENSHVVTAAACPFVASPTSCASCSARLAQEF